MFAAKTDIPCMLMDIPYILYGRGSAPVRLISIDVGHTHILCNSTIVQRENKGVQCPALPLRNAIGTGALASRREACVASAFAFEGECIRIASRSATFLLKPVLGMREDEGTDPASRRGIPSSEELEVVSSLLLSTPASSLLLDMPPLHKGTGSDAPNN